MNIKELSKLLKNISILYVEDDQDTQEQMMKVLLQLSNNVCVATTGMEALEVYKEKHPQIIISDIAMPNLNGIEFIKKIRENNKTVPIILLTAHNDVDYLLPAANLNIQSYIIKPITSTKLKEVLYNALEYLNISSSIYLNISDEYKYDKNNSEIVNAQNEKIKLNKKETKLMNLLIENQNRVVTYSEIERYVWMEYDEVMTSMALRTVIKNLRKKISTEFIKNVSGQGYKLVIA